MDGALRRSERVAAAMFILAGRSVQEVCGTIRNENFVSHVIFESKYNIYISLKLCN